MSRLAWIFPNHCPDQVYSSYHSIAEDDLVVAVDGGLDFLIKKRIEPDLIVGDFDSLSSPDLLLKYSQDKIHRLPEQKNETDCESAIDLCLRQGYQNILICNDLMGRFDHALGLIQNLLYAHRQGINAKIESERQVLFFLSPETSLNYPLGSMVSLIAYSESSQLKSSQGLEYPLTDLTLYTYQSRGISNRILSSPASIELQSGSILCVVTIL